MPRPYTFTDHTDAIGERIEAADVNAIYEAIETIDAGGTNYAARLDQIPAPTASVSMGGQKITGLAAPTADDDAATKAYADAIANGLTVKRAVRVATTANITLSGEQVIDGISVVAGDRVLVKNQSTASQNGLYDANLSTWTRTEDADANAEVTSGLFVAVIEGTTNGRTGFILITPDPITVGTTALEFTTFSFATGAGITIQDEATPLTTLATTINFAGSGVVASGSGATKTVTISGSAANLPFATAASIGMVANNSTDNGAIVNAWINSLPTSGNARGGRLYVPSGLYRFTTPIVINRSGVSIIGDSVPCKIVGGGYSLLGTVFLAATASMKLIDIDPDTNSIQHNGVTIEGINLFDDVGGAGNSATGVYIRMTNNWMLRNVHTANFLRHMHVWSDVLGVPGGTVSGGDAAWGMIDNCFIKTGTRGIYSEASAGFVVFGGEVTGFSDIGIAIHNSVHVRVMGVKIDSCFVGVDLDNSHANRIVGNGFEVRDYANGIGIRIGNTTTSRRNYIAGNHLTGATAISGETAIRLGEFAGAVGHPNYILHNPTENIDNPITVHATAVGRNWIEGILPTHGKFGRHLPDNTLPATCVQGEEIRVGGNIYRCSATDTWTAM